MGCGDYKKPDAIGIDIKPKSKADIRASVDYLPFNIRFDEIRMFEVLEHLVNPLQALTNIRQILKPEGFFLLSIPNMMSIDCMVRFAVWGELSSSEEHIYSWTVAEIVHLLDKAGFVVDKIGFSTPSRYFPKTVIWRRLFRAFPRLSEKSMLVEASRKRELA